MKNIFAFLLVCALPFQISCSKEKSNLKLIKDTIILNEYWNNGVAEINVYELSQNRYQDNHPGQLISVFVKEDFLTEKQVKNEYYKNDKSTLVLKNIQIRKFTTGIYDYALFTSTFTPFDKPNFPKTLKVSASSQEWCGTIYTQFNLKEEDYETQQFSYFEKEGDTNGVVKNAVLEDEIYNTIRMNPELLPKGKFQLIPAANFIQLKHLERKSFLAFAELEKYNGKDFEGENLYQYKIEIAELERELIIVFENNSPFKIVGWLDRFPSSFDNKIRTTSVRLQNQKLLPYWNLNSLADTKLRKELGIN